jgi:hypothetical protein
MTTATRATAVQFERPADYRAELTAPASGVRFLEIPERRYLMVDGTARPGEDGFGGAISTLYTVAYTLHFALKRKGIDAPVGAMSGLYWIGREGPITASQFEDLAARHASWTWRLMLPVPDEATERDVAAAVDEARAKKRPPLIDELRWKAWHEGRVAQTMHVGPYSAERPSIERLHAAIEKDGFRLRGCHHEIYISDPNRTRPERMKTLIRQPVVA